MRSDMTNFDQLLVTASRTAEPARRLRAIADDTDEAPTTRLTADTTSSSCN